ANLRLYTNGVQVAIRAQTGAIAISTGPLTIGSDATFGQYFAGRIDEVRVYNRALSASEIQTDLNTPVGGGTIPIDTTPPTTPGNLVSSTFSTSEIRLTWTASTDTVGVTGYLVERQNSPGGAFVGIGTTATTSFNNTGLAPATTYGYRVQATDAAGN